MILFSTTYIVIAAFILAASIGITILGWKLATDSFKFELPGVLLTTAGVILDIILVIYLAVSISGFITQRTTEHIKYEQTLVEQQSIQQVIDTTEDVVNSEIYLKAIEFNTNLAHIQKAQEDPFFALSFSGNVDWTTVPFVNIG